MPLNYLNTKPHNIFVLIPRQFRMPLLNWDKKGHVYFLGRAYDRKCGGDQSKLKALWIHGGLVRPKFWDFHPIDNPIPTPQLPSSKEEFWCCFFWFRPSALSLHSPKQLRRSSFFFVGLFLSLDPLPFAFLWSFFLRFEARWQSHAY